MHNIMAIFSKYFVNVKFQSILLRIKNINHILALKLLYTPLVRDVKYTWILTLYVIIIYRDINKFNFKVRFRD